MAKKDEILKEADKKALELGYDISQMERKIRKTDTVWEVYYHLKQQKGKGVVGGDLNIWIDTNGKIQKISRGR